MTSTRFASRLGVLAIVSVVLGALAGLTWRNLVDLPVYVVQADGRALISQADLTGIVSADVVFALVGLPTGLALGGAAWWLLHRAGWPVALAAAGAGLVAALACWGIGLVLGPGDVDTRLAEATPGERVPVEFALRAWSALALWMFAAVMVPLFAAALGPETWSAPGGRSPRPRPSEDAEVG